MFSGFDSLAATARATKMNKVQLADSFLTHAKTRACAFMAPMKGAYGVSIYYEFAMRLPCVEGRILGRLQAVRLSRSDQLQVLGLQ